MSEFETQQTDAEARCGTHGCRNAGVKDVLVPMVIDKQVAIVEEIVDGQKWVARAVVRHPTGPMTVKKVLERMCTNHAGNWEPAPEV
ncbi:MAG: hypothetical protein JRN21_09985 [Nitrososphaerota archaeon]|nr:hypothetical protein [Nitrososphaerota archaeon]